MATYDSQSIRVLLVDDHKLVRAGMRLLIESQPGLVVVGEAANHREAKALTASQQPDVILLDLDLGDEYGLDVLPELLITAPNARIIILTGLRDLQALVKAIQLGASGAIQKDQDPEMVLRAIERVYSGEIWFDGTTMANMLSKLYAKEKGEAGKQKVSGQAEPLTNRERQIIHLVCQGMKNQQIATQLHISEGTVRNYLTIIYEKLGVKDRFGLIVYANHSGLGVYVP